MSPSAEDAQAQWLEQLAAMRKAIAELNLPANVDKAPGYGHDLDLDQDDFSATASGDDIWDIISDEYQEDYSSDQLDDDFSAVHSRNAYDKQWLHQKCRHVAQTGSGLDAASLEEQIIAILASDSNSKASWPREPPDY